jgi:tRNA-dihydrouridine synthase B
VGNGEGSALMKNPLLVEQIVSSTVKALKNTPVTVKIRAGWDAESKNASEVARAAEAGGAALICVHARTREQMYAPGIDLGVIEGVKRTVSVPVIGNGDIVSADDAVDMISKTGCDGVMIGRGALGNPWIFEEIAARLEGKNYAAPELSKRLETCIQHISLIRDAKGEHISAAEMKKHAALYIKGVHSAAAIRDSIMKTTSTAQIEEIIRNVIETNA